MTFGTCEFDEQRRRLIEAELEKPIPMDRLSMRSGGQAGTMTYLPGNIAIDLANYYFGFNGWSTKIDSLKVDFEEKDAHRWSVSAEAIVTVTLSDGTYRQDVGCGDSINKLRAKAQEAAKKEAVTDAIKRALRQLGNGLGNCIYDPKYVKEAKRGRGDQYVPAVPSRAHLYKQCRPLSADNSVQRAPGNPALNAGETKATNASAAPSKGHGAKFKHEGNAYTVSEVKNIASECIDGSWTACAQSFVSVSLPGGAQRQDTGFGYTGRITSKKTAEYLAKENAVKDGMKRVGRQMPHSMPNGSSSMAITDPSKPSIPKTGAHSGSTFGAATKSSLPSPMRPVDQPGHPMPPAANCHPPGSSTRQPAKEASSEALPKFPSPRQNQCSGIVQIHQHAHVKEQPSNSVPTPRAQQHVEHLQRANLVDPVSGSAPSKHPHSNPPQIHVQNQRPDQADNRTRPRQDFNVHNDGWTSCFAQPANPPGNQTAIQAAHTSAPTSVEQKRSLATPVDYQFDSRFQLTASQEMSFQALEGQRETKRPRNESARTDCR